MSSIVLISSKFLHKLGFFPLCAGLISTYSLWSFLTLANSLHLFNASRTNTINVFSHNKATPVATFVLILTSSDCDIPSNTRYQGKSVENPSSKNKNAAIFLSPYVSPNLPHSHSLSLFPALSRAAQQSEPIITLSYVKYIHSFIPKFNHSFH